MNNNQGRLTSILKQEASALEGLYSLLMKELVALKENDSESINTLSEEKNIMLDELQQLDNERQLFINTEKKLPVNSTFSNDISILSNEIKICLNKCKQQNNINGGIIEMSQLFNTKMLDILSGNSEKQSTYDVTGKSDTQNSQHSIARV